MLTYLYPSSPQKERGKKRFMNYAEMSSPYASVLVTGYIKSLILVIWLCFLLLSPVAVFTAVYFNFVLKSMHTSSRVNTQNLKVLKGKHNVERCFVAHQQKKIEQSPDCWTYLFHPVVCSSLCVPVACRGLRCLASLVCTQSVCDYCPLQAPCTVMRLFTKQLHLHRFCQEPLKS